MRISVEAGTCLLQVKVLWWLPTKAREKNQPPQSNSYHTPANDVVSTRRLISAASKNDDFFIDALVRF